jgi:iron complex outermembrane receptor protein
LRWSTRIKGTVISSQSREDGYQDDLAVNQELCDAGDSVCVTNPEGLIYHNLASYVSHNLSLSYHIDFDNDTTVRLFGGLNNIFDDRGSFIVGGRGNFDGDYGGDMGRFAYVVAELKLD